MEQRKVIFNKWLYRRLPYFVRRKLTPQQSPFVLVVILAFVVILLQTLSFLMTDDERQKLEEKADQILSKRRPALANVLGIDKSKMQHYMPNDRFSFTCFTSHKKIPFEYVNDDFCDCPEDGADEPATSACRTGKFYCSLG